MDFFEAQDQARRRTKWLILWFFLAIIGVVAAVNFLFVLILGNDFSSEYALLVSLGTGGVILAASGFKTLQLNGGGAVVAHDLGGRLLMPGTTDFEEKRLLNIVEEMAIASGMPVPQVYLLDDEEGINAFAAGTEPSNAVIGVTRGCLQRLSRDELSGVVAHEFSHILNGDMRLNMRIIGVIFGLLVISIIGRTLLEMLRYQSFSSRRNDRGNNAVLVFLALGLGLLVIGAVGSFFGSLIQAAISRQREFLADASAVQFTRNPDSITGALKKIGGFVSGSKIKNSKAAEASHMFFSSGGIFSFGMKTHPPIEVRIKAVDASWDGKFATSSIKRVAESAEKPREKKTKGPFGALPGVMMLDENRGSGKGLQRDLNHGQQIFDSIPDQWLAAAHDRDEAQALVFGLVLAEDGRLQEEERQFLEEKAGREACEAAVRWHEELVGVHSSRKIALIEVALATLRALSLPEYRRFSEITEWLIASDGEVDLFEFMMQRMISRHLESHFEKRALRKIRHHSFNKLLPQANLLVSALAGIGTDQTQEADAAHAAAASAWQGNHIREAVPSLDVIDGALEQFDQSSPLVQRQLLIACGKAVANDGKLTSDEAVLIRSIADRIGCPIPPFVQGLEEEGVN